MARSTKSAPVAAAKAPARKLTAKQLQAALQAKLDADSNGADDKASKAAARAAAKAAAPKPAKAKAVAAPKAKAVDPDLITYSGPDKTMKNAGKLVVKAGDQTILLDGDKLTKKVLQLAEVNCSLAALQAYLSASPAKAKLANGLTAQNAPHSAKAIADAAPKRAAKASAPRAAKATATKDGDDRVIKSVVPNPKRGKSAERFALYKAGMTVAEALAAGLTRGDIAWDSQRDFITFA